MRRYSEPLPVMIVMRVFEGMRWDGMGRDALHAHIEKLMKRDNMQETA
jgi:hypothetical protein